MTVSVNLNATIVRQQNQHRETVGPSRLLFRGRRGDLIKILWWSGDGMNLYVKRLERGRFVWPQANSGTVHLSAAQLSMLLEGIDWRHPERTWQPTHAA
ncbi:transposase [Burkholderia cenocepacia]|nr:transposase [Burkholderia cenocepacia]